MIKITKVVGLLISLLLSSSFSGCKYESEMEARIACYKWAAARKGIVEVDDDGDGQKGKTIENSSYEFDKLRYQSYTEKGYEYRSASGYILEPRAVNPPKRYVHVNGETIVNLRDCILEEKTRQWIGLEHDTPYAELISREEFEKIEIKYNKFPY